MTIRVVQWATGGVGRAAIDCVRQHPDLELVGCWVHSAEKSGRDVGEILGGAAIGVTATNDVDAILALDADCVVYAPLMPNAEEVAALLASGKNVVTPTGWVYPDQSRLGTLLEACERGDATLHGTGIHPGGITERLPLLLSGWVAGARFVRAEEFSDIRTYGAPDVVRDIMGFGLTPEQAMASPMASLLGAGFKQSLRMVVDAMGFGTDARTSTTEEVAVAVRPIDSPIGVIEPGQVAARRFRWEATVDGAPVVSARVNWLMGEEGFDPDWTLGEEGERFEVEVVGDPSVTAIIRGLQPESIAAGLERNPGVVSTANHCVNAIPAVCAAEPGIKTYLDLPFFTGKAAPDLSTARG
ncbi:NAD(P)H-dependent amine dehydrogenase family protein [Nocardioides massiliensis]|uniref:Dihydrodipicolinate reductase n=1 Tax=Nocardioides massiliensis TaxID=1325935 RepID=A0ABT9NUA5_9ACTN|nr:dihydrodipicolinate reductase [Nocardioides massiliensis]MDP9824008.1 hypothetical protein [Nocardioides massiliensis]